MWYVVVNLGRMKVAECGVGCGSGSGGGEKSRSTDS
jgi:hypothetical protein